MPMFMRRDGVSAITHNDRCPRRPFAQLAVVALIALAVLWLVPGSHPFFLVAGILIVTAILSLIIRWNVRRKRSRMGACLTCDHPCVQRLPDAEPVPVRIGKRPEWSDNEHVWQELQAYDRARNR